MAILEAKTILVGFIKTFKPVLNEDVPLVMRGLVTNAPVEPNILRLEMRKWYFYVI